MYHAPNVTIVRRASVAPSPSAKNERTRYDSDETLVDVHDIDLKIFANRNLSNLAQSWNCLKWNLELILKCVVFSIEWDQLHANIEIGPIMEKVSIIAQRLKHLNNDIYYVRRTPLQIPDYTDYEMQQIMPEVTDPFIRRCWNIKIRLTMQFFCLFDFYVTFPCYKCFDSYLKSNSSESFLSNFTTSIPGLEKRYSRRMMKLGNILCGNPNCKKHSCITPWFMMVSVASMFRSHPGLLAVWLTHGGRVDKFGNPTNMKEMCKRNNPFLDIRESNQRDIKPLEPDWIHGSWFDAYSSDLLAPF